MTIPLENDPILHSVPVVHGRKKIGSYLLERLLGRGGMGAVYLGRHETLGHEVAVKCLMPSAGGASDEQVQRFWREAKIAANVVDPNLIQVRDLGMEHGLHYMVMDFIDGESAEQRVLRSGPLEFREALTIILYACRGLAAGHGHDPVIVHRDVKPQNIMISRSGDVRVADLGIARIESGDLLTLDSRVFGTPNYMPLEQFRSAADVTCASDVYSVGAMLCYLLTGEHPFVARTPFQMVEELRDSGFPDLRELVPDVPNSVAELVRAATAVERSSRPVDAAALAEMVSGVLDELGGPVSLAFGGGRKRQSVLASDSIPPMTIDDAAGGVVQPTISDAAGGGGSAVAAPEAISIPDAGPAPRSGGRGGLWIGALVICSILAGGAYAYSEWSKRQADGQDATARDQKKGNSEKGNGRDDEDERRKRQRALEQLPSDWAALAKTSLDWPASRDAKDPAPPNSHALEEFASECKKLRALGSAASWEFEALTVEARVNLIAALDRFDWEWRHLGLTDGEEIESVRGLRAQVYQPFAGSPRADLSICIKEHSLAQVRHELAHRDELPKPNGASWVHLAIARRASSKGRNEESLQILRDVIYREGADKGMSTPIHALYQAVLNADVGAVKALLDAGVDRAALAGERRRFGVLSRVFKKQEIEDLLAKELCTLLSEYPLGRVSKNSVQALLNDADDQGIRALEQALEKGLVDTAGYLVEQHREHDVPIWSSRLDDGPLVYLVDGLSLGIEHSERGLKALELALELAGAAGAVGVQGPMQDLRKKLDATGSEPWPAELEERLSGLKSRMEPFLKSN